MVAPLGSALRKAPDKTALAGAVLLLCVVAACSRCHICCCVFSDRAMQLNEARFEMNYRCGYVLQHPSMRHDRYSPYEKAEIADSDPLILNIQVIFK